MPPRLYHLKSRTGCARCRLRRVKVTCNRRATCPGLLADARALQCDEAKPVCVSASWKRDGRRVADKRTNPQVLNYSASVRIITSNASMTETEQAIQFKSRGISNVLHNPYRCGRLLALALVRPHPRQEVAVGLPMPSKGTAALWPPRRANAVIESCPCSTSSTQRSAERFPAPTCPKTFKYGANGSRH